MYLTPTTYSEQSQIAHMRRGPYRLVQKAKTFSPHLLVVPVGAEVEFPNEDRVFHNVFSVYDNTKFDLGLYEAGSTKKIRFSRPGASYIFCNIHPEMSAVVFAIDTPIYAVTDVQGEYQLKNVPDGRYRLRVWSERAQESDLRIADQTIEVRRDAVLPEITIKAAASIAQGHKNKFGKDYDLSSPTKYPH